MTDEILEAVQRVLRSDHPVMAAMATKLERLPGPKEPASVCTVRLTFDGPALPEKQTADLVVYVAGAVPALVPPFLDECERSVAAAMKKSGLGV